VSARERKRKTETKKTINREEVAVVVVGLVLAAIEFHRIATEIRAQSMSWIRLFWSSLLF
jgi:stalled ribosome rescue protein Dom34